MDLKVGDIVLIDDVGPEDSYHRLREKFKYMICVVVHRDLMTHRYGYWAGRLESLFENNPYDPRSRQINFYQVKLTKL